MNKRLETFNDVAFSAKLSSAISKLAATEQQGVATKLNILRTQFYQDFLSQTFLPDCEETLLKFYEQVEKPCLEQETAVMTTCSEANFSANASKHIQNVFKTSAKNSADVELNISFYDAFKVWMAAVEDFRNVLNSLTFYLEDICQRMIKDLELKTSDKVKYKLGAFGILYIVLLKGLKRAVMAVVRLTNSEATKQLTQMLFFIVVSMMIGTEQARVAPKLHRNLAVGLIPLSSFFDVLCPLNMDAKVIQWLNGKECNLHVRLMRQELKRSAMFFRGGANRLRGHLNDYARIVNFFGEPVQAAVDKKIMIVRQLEALIKGEDFDPDTLKDFIAQADVRLTDLGRGWQLVEDVEDEESPIPTRKKSC